MKAIAEFAMRSQLHAIGVSMTAAALPLLGWLSTVIVVLVCLRQGFAAASVVLLWTMLPVGMLLYVTGDPSPAIVLIGTVIMSVLLRQTLSWELVLITAVLLSAVGALLFEMMAAGVLERIAALYVDYLAQVDASLVISQEEAGRMLVGFFALGQACAMVIILIIARWAQAALYNPGGFRKEFHQLRLSPLVSGGIVVAMLLSWVSGDVLGRWLPLLTVPLLFAAVGLVHWLMALKELSANWVVAFYATLLLLFQLVYPFLASLALMDSWFNVRNRLEPSQKD